MIILFQYRQAVTSKFYPLQQKQKSFLTFGFGAGSSGTNVSASSAGRRESHVNVNVTPTSHGEVTSDTPEIRKYKKRFNSEILCAALWGKRCKEMMEDEFVQWCDLSFIIQYYFRCEFADRHRKRINAVGS